MKRTGRAAVVTELTGTFEILDVEVAAPIGREVCVEVRAAGLCHSDLSVASIDRGRSLPLIAGHELAGVVVAVGPEVASLIVGDHVVGTEVRACGVCLQCRLGRPTLCENPGALERPGDAPPRVTHDGAQIHTLGVSAFASYSLADERQFVRIPAELPFAEASLLGCGVTTGVGAVLNVARVQAGDTVAVFGIGGVGLNIVSGARLAGASAIVAVDIDNGKLELARAFGATHLVNGADEDPVTWITEHLPGGVDHTFDGVGIPEQTIAAIRSTARGGCTYLIGIPKPGRTLNLDTMHDMIGAQRGLRGIYMGGTNPARDLPRYADFFLSGRLALSELISETIALEEINRAYAEPALTGVRAIITDFS